MRKPRPDPDVSRFDDLVAEALEAFAGPDGWQYAIDICAQAHKSERQSESLSAGYAARRRWNELTGNRPKPTGWTYLDAVAVIEPHHTTE